MALLALSTNGGRSFPSIESVHEHGGLRQPGLVNSARIAAASARVAVLSRGALAPQEERGLRCSFCGKYQRQVAYLAIGPHGVNICQACLVLCQEIIAEEGPHQA